MQYPFIDTVGLGSHIYEIHLNPFKWIVAGDDSQRGHRSRRPILAATIAIVDDLGHFLLSNSVIFVSNLCPRLVSSHMATLDVQWPNELPDIVHHDHLSKVVSYLFQMIKLTILQSEVFDCPVSRITKLWSRSCFTRIYQAGLVFTSLSVTYSRFILFSILEMSKP